MIQGLRLRLASLRSSVRPSMSASRFARLQFCTCFSRWNALSAQSYSSAYNKDDRAPESSVICTLTDLMLHEPALGSLRVRVG